MAVFLLKAECGSSYVPRPRPAGSLPGRAVPGTFADWIERLARRANHRRLRWRQLLPLPTNNTRGQMAVFIGKAFALQILEKALRLP